MVDCKHPSWAHPLAPRTLLWMPRRRVRASASCSTAWHLDSAAKGHGCLSTCICQHVMMGRQARKAPQPCCCHSWWTAHLHELNSGGWHCKHGLRAITRPHDQPEADVAQLGQRPDRCGQRGMRLRRSPDGRCRQARKDPVHDFNRKSLHAEARRACSLSVVNL